MSNLGKVWNPSENLQSANRTPAAVETALDRDLPGAWGAGGSGNYKSRASNELPLSRLEEFELVPSWQRGLVLLGILAFGVLVFAGIVSFAVGLAARFS